MHKHKSQGISREHIRAASRRPALAALLTAIQQAGGMRSLARRMTQSGEPMTHQAISQWVQDGRCPPVRAASVARLTGVPAKKLRAAH